MRRDLADQRDVFFFYLTVISYANSTCKVKKGEDVDDSCPTIFFFSQRELQLSGSVIKTFADELSLWGSCQGKLFCSRDISKTQTIKFPRGKIPREK